MAVLEETSATDCKFRYRLVSFCLFYRYHLVWSIEPFHQLRRLRKGNILRTYCLAQTKHSNDTSDSDFQNQFLQQSLSLLPPLLDQLSHYFFYQRSMIETQFLHVVWCFINHRRAHEQVLILYRETVLLIPKVKYDRQLSKQIFGAFKDTGKTSEY